jgi:hypothetical protein
MDKVSGIFKRSDENKTAYHEIKVLEKLYSYRKGVKFEDTSSCPAFYLCQRIHPSDSRNVPFLVDEDDFDEAYTPMKQQGGLFDATHE